MLETKHMPFTQVRDQETGRVYWQLTDGESEAVAPYMEKGKWSADDRYLVFMSNRTGDWQPYRLQMDTGEVLPIVRVEDTSFRSVVVDAAGRRVFCQSGRQYIKSDLVTLRCKGIIDTTAAALQPPIIPEAVVQPGASKGLALNLNSDGTKCCFNYRTSDDQPAIVTMSTDVPYTYEVYPLPRRDIMPGHELFCPADDSIISFHGYPDRQNRADAGPDHRVAQWRFDLKTREMTPLAAVPPGYRATHGLWSPRGDRFFYFCKTVPDWTPVSIMSVDASGNDARVHFESSEYRLGHCDISLCGNWIVTDSQDPDENVLILIHMERDEYHLLCKPNMSNGSDRPDRRLAGYPAHTDRHTHPGFSRTGRFVVFTSDVTGRSQVYVMSVEDLTQS